MMASLVSFLLVFHLTVIMSTSEVFSDLANSPTAKPMEKLTQLHFYFHDNTTGKNPTAMQIIAPPKGSPGAFGATNIMDDPLTEAPSPSSKLIGRSQGIYAVASQHELGLLMVFNFVFIEGGGVYNGSTLSIVGRNVLTENVREMPVVGGTGMFRYARGFALAKTYIFNITSGVAIVEFNVSVMHF